ncbi:hypothetical protein F2Q70_00010366 [Brassica cretica]|uniref:Uncharacterized protein n=1 Tax=Brassica cretica TaxID=69181 RepID=A0A8S9LVK0_BRACR|nr:hypothetical protein F2Q70_00010366 [Brassica cretica]
MICYNEFEECNDQVGTEYTDLKTRAGVELQLTWSLAGVKLELIKCYLKTRAGVELKLSSQRFILVKGKLNGGRFLTKLVQF